MGFAAAAFLPFLFGFLCCCFFASAKPTEEEEAAGSKSIQFWNRRSGSLFGYEIGWYSKFFERSDRCDGPWDNVWLTCGEQHQGEEGNEEEGLDGHLLIPLRMME